MKPVGLTRGRSDSRVSAEGFPAKTYVPPQ